MKNTKHTCGLPHGKWHTHVCRNPECNHEWKHQENSSSCLACHECPKCGEEQWWRKENGSEKSYISSLLLCFMKEAEARRMFEDF